MSFEPNNINNAESWPLQRAQSLLLINGTSKGRGVFASAAISKGTVVEVSPVLVFTPEEVEQHTSQTVLHHYTYYWPSPNGGPQTQALALGLGSMFNHSRLRQNVIWKRDVAAGTIVYTAHRDIAAGEELCISYGNVRLWFKDADAESDSDGVEGKDELGASGLDAISMVSSDGDGCEDIGRTAFLQAVTQYRVATYTPMTFTNALTSVKMDILPLTAKMAAELSVGGTPRYGGQKEDR